MLDGSWGGRMRACGEGVGVFAGTGMLARQDPQRGVRGVYRMLGVGSRDWRWEGRKYEVRKAPQLACLVVSSPLLMLKA